MPGDFNSDFNSDFSISISGGYIGGRPKQRHHTEVYLDTALIPSLESQSEIRGSYAAVRQVVLDLDGFGLPYEPVVMTTRCAYIVEKRKHR